MKTQNHPMRNLSKSKILAYRQCPKRLWLEVHRPELRDDSASEAVFAIGNQVGEVARQVFDPHGAGAFIDINVLGHAEAIRQSATLLADGSGPVFEAGITASGALAYADVMLPDRSDGTLRWRMIEVKSSASVKDYHRDDIAVQSFIAAEAGVPLASISVAHINSGFIYFGGDRYDGLFEVVDLTEETADRHEEVRQWLTLAHEIANQAEEPGIETGDHCHKPFTCGFCDYCNRDKTFPEYPLSSLPGIRQARRAAIEETGVDDLREAPDELLSAIQQRVKQCSVTGEPYFNAEGAAAELAAYGDPAYFLDFETIAFAVPRWEGTRPYQQLPFQFSLHIVHGDGRMEHHGFLDLSGADPSQACAVELIRLCGNKGPIFAYNAGFESLVIRELAERFHQLAPHLHAIASRLVDLLPIARRHYYHPSQHGSWSIKAVLPALCPDLSYNSLDGVQDGNMAQTAYQEAIAPETTGERKAQLRDQLHEYCKLDTLAMVRIWEVFNQLDRMTAQ
jgi:predicted RecB family nuclease